jgi:phosphatidylinositol phospholipase C epsilon
LKPFWLSLSEKEDSIATLEILSQALLGESSSQTPEKDNQSSSTSWAVPEYDSALQRALKISTCPVVPFFGAYIRELRSILSTSSLVVLSTGSEHQQLQVRTVCSIIFLHFN